MVVSCNANRLSWSIEPGVSIRVGERLHGKMKDSDEGIRRFSGDGLSLRMDSNHRILEVTGDGCRITLVKNCGSVRVVGDGCRVKINHNVGDIVYTGDGGHVLLGPESSRERVKYVGDGGKVTFDTDPCRSSKAQKTKEQKVEHEGINLENNPSKVKTKSKTRCSVKSSVGLKLESDTSPEVENIRNGSKEAAQDVKRRSKDCRQSDKTVLITTTTVTSPRSQEHNVKRWIIGPTSVVSSLSNEGCSMKITSKSSRTVVRAK